MYPGNFALNFSATHRDVVRVPHNEGMNHPLIDSWTIEAWVYPFNEQKHPGKADGIINIVGFPERHPMLGMTSDGFAVTQLMDHKGKWYTYQGTTHLKAGWHHVAATWDGRSAHAADNKLCLYVDGVLEVAGGALDDGTGQPKAPLAHGYTAANQCTPGLCEEGMQIGGLYCCQGGGYTGRFFSGVIDEVRVWTRALPPQEIDQRMKRPLNAQDEQQLLFYFPLDDAGMEISSNVVESKALSWWGLLGTSVGLGRPSWSLSNAPLTCPANSRAPACLLQTAVATASSPWFTSGKSGYSLFTILAAVLATIALTSTLASILTHAVITGKVVLPPGLSNLGALFARILPGSDYRRTGSADTEHRSDWTWAQPHRREGTPRGISGTAGAGAVSTPSSYGT